MMHFNILSSAKKKKKKNSRVDHKATEIIHYSLVGLQPHFEKQNPGETLIRKEAGRLTDALFVITTTKNFFGKSKIKAKITTLKTYPHENVSVHL